MLSTTPWQPCLGIMVNVQAESRTGLHSPSPNYSGTWSKLALLYFKQLVWLLSTLSTLTNGLLWSIRVNGHFHLQNSAPGVKDIAFRSPNGKGSYSLRYWFDGKAFSSYKWYWLVAMYKSLPCTDNEKFVLFYRTFIVLVVSHKM